MRMLSYAVLHAVLFTSCFFLDTEGSFIVERVVEIALAAVQHISSVADKSEDPGKDSLHLIEPFSIALTPSPPHQN